MYPSRRTRASARALALFLSLTVVAGLAPALAQRGASAATPRQAGSPEDKPRAFVPGEILVRFRGDSSKAAAARRELTALRARDGRRIPVALETPPGLQVVRGLRLARVSPAETLEAVESLRALPATLTPEQFVDTLNANAGGALSAEERGALVNGLTNGTLTRAQVLRAVAEDADFTRAEFNRAFVLMQYFGYLRRDPDAAPDADFAGYNFWLGKLDEFKGDYVRAEMVKAFLDSIEYRKRFGTP